jgi:hypothetical protein
MSNIAMSIRSQRRDPWPTSPAMASAGVSAAEHLLPSLSGSRETSSPNVNNKSHVITAVVDQAGERVHIAAGGVAGTYTLFVKDGTPV